MQVDRDLWVNRKVKTFVEFSLLQTKINTKKRVKDSNIRDKNITRAAAGWSLVAKKSFKKAALSDKKS